MNLVNVDRQARAPVHQQVTTQVRALVDEATIEEGAARLGGAVRELHAGGGCE